MYLTQDYRPIEFGVITVGAVATWAGIVLPPKTETIRTTYGCHKNCTNVFLLLIYL